MTRRDANWAILQTAASAAGQAFFAAWLPFPQARAADAHSAHRTPPADPHDWSSYRPQFFSPSEFSRLDHFTAILIPTDDTPGAREANVAPFIDFVVHSASTYAPELQARWRTAMAWLESARFSDLTAPEREALVDSMQAPQHPGHPTYQLLKEMTIHAFYTSRVGLVDVLDYQGLAYLTAFPACNHPEHRQI
jgi:hypothetical protein